jgi:iron-sulfur cluster repair protein YtfE (RIC family)
MEGGMATSASAIHKDSSGIHNDHVFLAQLLDKFEASLSRLSHSFNAAEEAVELEAITRLARLLGDELPQHCRREEESLFASVSAVSEELAEFCEEMKREHTESIQLLDDFRALVQGARSTENLTDVLPHLIERGLEMSCSLRAHVTREESELSGFL